MYVHICSTSITLLATNISPPPPPGLFEDDIPAFVRAGYVIVPGRKIQRFLPCNFKAFPTALLALSEKSGAEGDLFRQVGELFWHDRK